MNPLLGKFCMGNKKKVAIYSSNQIDSHIDCICIATAMAIYGLFAAI